MNRRDISIEVSSRPPPAGFVLIDRVVGTSKLQNYPGFAFPVRGRVRYVSFLRGACHLTDLIE